MRPILLLLLHFVTTYGVAHAQVRFATINGRIEDNEGKPMSGVTISILGRPEMTTSNATGFYTLNVKPGRAFALVYSFTGYKTVQRNFILNAGETELANMMLEPGETTLENVTVTAAKNRREAGLVAINPKMSLQAPAPIGGIENMLKVLVGSNNELTSQYNVRGGSYDENLVYVNDFEVFRPYLIRNGQQEGLSFINPELARNVNFYNGGFQARYGDKMSSVLDVEYRTPTKMAGSAYAGLLEQGFHLEGTAAKKVTFLIAARNRNLRNLLQEQETKGNYIPRSSDLQGTISWKPNDKWQMELMGNLSGTRFELEPTQSSQTTSVFTPYYSQNLGLDVYFDGREEDRYSTRMLGLSATRKISSSFSLKGMLSYIRNQEEENINIAGAYLFGERSFDKDQPDFGLITNPLGAGVFLNHARNKLDVQVMNATLRGYLDKKNHYLQFGNTVELNSIADNLNEFEYQDSAGYSLPNQPGPLVLFKSLRSTSDLTILRFSGFVQDNMMFNKMPGLAVQAGMRYNYNDLNNELLLSPRAGASYRPVGWKKDVVFKASGGLYHQPPFYREMRRYDGTVNTQLKAQRSAQVSAGVDFAFEVAKRPFRLTTEAYYKGMNNVVPYDIDNVRLRYYGENMAKAYAYGLETRLFGEVVRDAESWISIGFMKTMEDLKNDFYYDYYNKNGELIAPGVDDQEPADSVQQNVGWLRRPTDRRVNFGMFFSDYLTTNKNFRVYVQGLFGTNLPYNIPGSARYRNALEIPSYIRVDIGFSYQLLPADKTVRRSHSPFKNLENMWLNFEVFNLLDRDNTISYLLIKDFANNTYAIPNRLTPRLLNLKLIVRW
jgi:hypothetical protein